MLRERDPHKAVLEGDDAGDVIQAPLPEVAQHFIGLVLGGHCADVMGGRHSGVVEHATGFVLRVDDNRVHLGGGGAVDERLG